MQVSDQAEGYKPEWIATPRDLTDWVNAFYVLQAGPGTVQDVMPAYSAQATLFVEGSIEMQFPEVGPTLSSTISFNAPLMQAIPFTMTGPAVIVGASLTPLGWVALSGMPADEVNNRSVTPEAFLPPSEVESLHNAIEQCRSGQMAVEKLCGALGDVFRRCIGEPNPVHRALVGAINAWLSASLDPKTDALYASTHLSKRQVQRLSRRYFGVPPSQLAKRYRAIRAAMLLANDGLPASMREQILATYFDQAHLIRDLRRFTGRTPKGLPDAPLIEVTLDPQGHGETAKALLSNPYAPQKSVVANDSQEFDSG